MAEIVGLPNDTLSARRRNAGPFKRGLLFSAVVHLSLLAALVVGGLGNDVAQPPVYRVELIGAPPGKRQEGVVNAAPKPVAPKPAASGAERPPPVASPLPNKAAPAQKTPLATPSPAKTKDAGAKSTTPEPKATAAPQAGAGAQGGKGADVANVNIRGIEFPFPVYLNNIVRQVRLNWDTNRPSTLVAIIKFTIRRNGSVADIEIVTTSGDRIYNADAMGAIEAVGATRGFGPLPAGYADDALVVYLTFDYAFRS